MRKYLFSLAVLGLILAGCGGKQPAGPVVDDEIRFRPALSKPAAKLAHRSQAVVVATVTRDGVPVSGAEVALSRSISGWPTNFEWSGTTDDNGVATVDIMAPNASGYYVVRATEAEEQIGWWTSVPINGGRESALSLPIGGPASVTSSTPLVPAEPPVATKLALSFSGIQPLLNGFHYEGWAIVDGAPVTTGKFNVNADGALVDLQGNPIPNGRFETGTDLGGASAIVITIEPADDTDAIPADTHYLAGSVAEGASSLTVGHPAALGDDFSSASGTYILATPTDGATDTDENSGLWFLDPSGPSAGLQLPTLPAGWKYEGWAVIDGTPVTTGTFTDPTGADDSAPFSGDSPGPPFPGEDFVANVPAGLTFPTDLAGMTAVVSIEPFPDDAPGPFTLKPLVGGIPADATDRTPYSIDNNAAGFPTGIATIE